MTQRSSRTTQPKPSLPFERPFIFAAAIGFVLWIVVIGAVWRLVASR